MTARWRQLRVLPLLRDEHPPRALLLGHDPPLVYCACSDPDPVVVGGWLAGAHAIQCAHCGRPPHPEGEP